MKAGIIAFCLLAVIIKWRTFGNTRCMLAYVILFAAFCIPRDCYGKSSVG